MHPRSRHQGRYDFKLLTKALPELSQFIVTKFGNETIDFTDPRAVKALNRALLKSYYGIHFWDIPDNFLCPPIPGRADYVHAIADLVGGKPDPAVRVLDIGVGANCIYPLIGQAEYEWKFVGADIDEKAVKCARNIITKNNLNGAIEIRHQRERNHFFEGIILVDECYHLTMCNPPFHASAEEAREGTQRKWKNLGKKISTLNFGGTSHELWFPGGEKAFITAMIRESKKFGKQCLWFSTLVSREENLKDFEKVIKETGACETRVLKMEQGQKKSRALSWTFGKR
jgi:23S rRNA (adenine1618-N6)-methyltransferase